MRFSQEYIERVQEANNLVDLISQHTQLKSTGSSLMGRCPFPDHREKTPSFSVSEIKQVYHCFGCHKSGNIFSFLRDFQGLSFPEAIEYLAARANIALPKQSLQEDEQEDKLQRQKKEIIRANFLAMEFFERNLKNLPPDHPTKKYISRRGISPESISEFHIGYANRDWDGLYQYLKQNSVSVHIAEEARLIVARKDASSGHFDMFRDRLMFPILNALSQPLGFGGRIIEEGEPKYLNSPETPVFTKGRILYGLPLSAKHIRSDDLCILVEGYMDVVSLYQSGIQNIGASLGTAFTLDHGKIIKRMTSNVLALFDGDAAGQEAAERSLPIFLQAGLFPKALIIPGGQDPDDFVKSFGAEVLKQEISKARDLFFVVLDKWFANYKEDPAEKIKIIDRAKPIFQLIPDPRLRDLYFTELAQRLNVSSQWLVQATFDKDSRGKAVMAFHRTPNQIQGREIHKTESTGLPVESEKISLKGLTNVERSLLSLSLKSRANFDELLKNNSLEFVSHLGVKAVIQKASEVYRQSPERFDKLTGQLVNLVDEPQVLFPEVFLKGSVPGEESIEIETRLFKDVMKRMRQNYLLAQIKQLLDEIKKDPSQEKMEQLMNIQKDIRNLDSNI